MTRWYTRKPDISPRLRACLIAGAVLVGALAGLLVLPRAGRAAVDPGKTTFWVVLEARPNLAAVAVIPDPVVRRRRLVAELRTIARRTQAPLLAELRARGASVRSFWIVNALLVQGPPALAGEVARRPEVARVFPAVTAGAPLPTPEPAPARRMAGVEWHVQKVGAPQVWADEGVRGEGIVIGIADTGVAWSHPALAAQERHVTGTQLHDYAWHDAFDVITSAPQDDLGHGTHVAGIAVGDDGGSNQIGVAPGAAWIACRNMQDGVGSPASYLDCFQWFLAPTRLDGSDPRPDLAPHIVNNSWVCVESEGCTDEHLDILLEAVRTLRLAGILVVAAAGNAGNGCGTVRYPPAIYAESLSVGASTATDQLASFSSRGPVTRDGSQRPKPDLSAPGVSVRSSYPGDQYTYMSGTSMAAPAVSGVAALLWSAVPHVRGRVPLTEHLLRASARPMTDTACGGDADGHPNNSWGWGLVDAPAAVDLGKTCPAFDWDGDGAVTGAEVAAVQDRLGEPVTPETTPYDLDGDGAVDQDDLDLILNALGQQCRGLLTLRLQNLHRTPRSSSVYVVTNTTALTLTTWHTFYADDGTLAYPGFQVTLGPSATYTVALHALPLPVSYTGQVTITALFFPDAGETPLRSSQYTKALTTLWFPLVRR